MAIHSKINSKRSSKRTKLTQTLKTPSIPEMNCILEADLLRKNPCSTKGSTLNKLDTRLLEQVHRIFSDLKVNHSAVYQLLLWLHVVFNL